MNDAQGLEKIAIDIGYGDVKVCYKNKLTKFCSAVTRVAKYEDDFDPQNSGLENIYKYDGKFYRVGEFDDFETIGTRNVNFLLKFSPILIAHALKLVGANDPSKLLLVTGLSVIDLKSTESFHDVVSSFEVDDKKVEFADTIVRPQGRGVFDDFEGDKSGYVYVVDIGFNTLDMLAYKNGVPEIRDNYADRNGANRIISQFQKMLTSNHPNMTFSQQYAKEIFVKGVAKFGGKEHDYRERINMLKQDYSDFIVSNLQTNERAMMADALIISGGGAYFIDEDVLKNDMPNAVLSEAPYEFSNVRGYYKYEQQ